MTKRLKTLEQLEVELRTARIHKFVTWLDTTGNHFFIELSPLVSQHKARQVQQYILNNFQQISRVSVQMQRHPETWEVSPCIKVYTLTDNK